MKKRWTFLLPGLAILAAAAIRLPALTAGLPYMSYVDEGHVLHHVTYLLAHQTCRIVARFGSTITSPTPGFFRGNAQTIYVLRRMPRDGATPPPHSS